MALAMKNSRVNAAIIVTIVTLSFLVTQVNNVGPLQMASASSSSDDWMMFRHDLSHSGSTTAESSTGYPRLLWAFQTMQAVWSSPAVVDGRVLVGCKDRNVYCLNCSNGASIMVLLNGW